MNHATHAVNSYIGVKSVPTSSSCLAVIISSWVIIIEIATPICSGKRCAWVPMTSLNSLDCLWLLVLYQLIKSVTLNKIFHFQMYQKTLVWCWHQPKKRWINLNHTSCRPIETIGKNGAFIVRPPTKLKRDFKLMDDLKKSHPPGSILHAATQQTRWGFPLDRQKVPKEREG